MKFMISLLLTALLAFLAGLWLSWWTIAIVSFLVALLIHQRAGKAFFSGFSGVFILWFVVAWWIDFKNEHLLSKQIAAILPLGGSSFLLILVTALVGGIVGGFGALTGSYLRARQ